MVAKLLRTEDDPVLAILRMALGLVFLAHAVQKLGWLNVYSSNSALELVPETVGISASLFLSVTAELIGGLGLILGLFGRIAAFVLATNILADIMLVHGRHGFFMNWLGNQGGEGIEYHLLALAITLSVLLNGSGAFSFDQALLRRFAPNVALPFSATKANGRWRDGLPVWIRHGLPAVLSEDRRLVEVPTSLVPKLRGNHES